MIEDELKVRIAKILQISVEDLNAESEIGKTRGWDSFTHVELLLFLEEAFNITLSEASLAYYSKLKNILKLAKKDEYER